MAYTTLAKIQSEYKGVPFSDTTAVTAADIAQFISDADAEINSMLSVKYRTPITGTESLVVMAMIATWLIKHRMQDIMQVKTGIPKTDQAGGAKTYRQMALDLLTSLASGKSKLTDSPLATSADGVKAYTALEGIENTFQLGVEQW